MTTTAPERSDVEQAFSAALRKDAAAAPASAPAPPRRDREAPFGRDPDGKPIAPHGIGVNGKPRLKPAAAGAGRPRKDAPRVQDAPDKAKAAGGKPDYTEDLTGLALTVWMAAAPLGATAPYAHIWKQSYPGMVVAWNKAAQDNATVRGYVRKLAGEGSWAWVIGVTVSTAPLIAGIWELARPEKDPDRKAEKEQLRKEFTELTRRDFDEFMTEQIKAMGLQPAGVVPGEVLERSDDREPA